MIGNDAWRQRQNDIFGETMDAAWLMRDKLEPLRPEVRHLLRVLADQAARDWALPDAGMWEERGVRAPPRVLEGAVLGRPGPGGPLR